MEKTNDAIMFKAEENMGDFLSLMDRWPQLTWEEVIDIVTVGVLDANVQRTFLDSILDARPQVSSPHQIPDLEKELRMAVSLSFHQMDRLGGLTGTASMVFKRKESVPPWEIYNPAILIYNFIPGAFGRVSGLPRMGKSNLACYLMEQYLAQGEDYYILTNILIDDKPAHVIFIRSARDLFRAISNLPDGSKFLFIQDEGGLSYLRADAQANRNKSQDRVARIIGKLGGSYLYIDQRDTAPSIIEEFCTAKFYCHSPGIVTIQVSNPQMKYTIKTKGFPLASLNFNTFDIGAFNPDDVPTSKLLEYMSGVDPKKAIKEFLEIHK